MTEVHARKPWQLPHPRSRRGGLSNAAVCGASVKSFTTELCYKYLPANDTHANIIGQPEVTCEVCLLLLFQQKAEQCAR